MGIIVRCFGRGIALLVGRGKFSNNRLSYPPSWIHSDLVFKPTILISLFLASNVVYGQLGENLTIGNAKATALANAVTADPPGIDSINFNPAGLAKVRTGKTGWNREVKFIGVTEVSIGGSISSPDGDPYAGQNLNVNGCVNQCLLGEDPAANGETKIEKFQTYIPGYGKAGVNMPAVVPNFGWTYRPHPKSRFTWGNTAMAPFAVGMQRSEDDPGVYAGKDIAIGRYVYFAPSVAYEINDQWTVGGSFTASMMGMFVGIDLRLPNLMLGALNTFLDDACAGLSTTNPLCVEGGNALDPFAPLAFVDIEMDDYFAPSFHLGVLYEPTDWFTWGMVYRHTTTHRLEGDYELASADKLAELFSGLYEVTGSLGDFIGLPRGVSGVQSGKASIELTFPKHIAMGISVRVTPQWKINVDYKWTEYGIWKEWVFKFDDPHDLSGILAIAFPQAPENTLPLERGYQNTGNWAYGLTYTYSDQLSFRAGYEFRPDVAPKEKRDLLLPISDMKVFGLGLFYRWDQNTEFDITLAHLLSESNIGANESSFTSTDPEDVLALYPGLDIETEMTLTMIQVNWSKTY